MRKETCAISAALLTALFFVPDTAGAHGRLPEVTRISFGPGGAVLARASFGLLVSKDGGAEWDLVCGAAVGFGLNEDPIYSASSDGAVFATTAGGLSVSHDGACTWANAPASGGIPFVDVTADGRIALSSRYVSTEGTSSHYETYLWRSGAKTGAPLEPTFVPNSFAANGARIDVAGIRYGEGGKRDALVLTSHDEGATWIESPVILESDEERIAAVASDGHHVYLRTLPKKDGASRLLVLSTEGIRTAYRAPFGLTGVAFSADLSEVWVAGARAGIEHASAKDFAFARTSPLEARCLAVDERGLWACAEDRIAGFEIGLSTDGGRTFAPRMRLCGVRGNASCAQGCTGEWEKERREIGCEEVVTPNASTPTPASAPPAPSTDGGAAEPSNASCAMASDRSSSPSIVAMLSVLLALLAKVRRVQSRHGGRELRDHQARRA